MASSAAALAERRRVASTIGGGKALVDVDTGEMNSEIGNGNHHEKPVGVSRKIGLRRPPDRQRSFKNDIGHIAAETYLITRLAFTLLGYLGYLICFIFRWKYNLCV